MFLTASNTFNSCTFFSHQPKVK